MENEKIINEMNIYVTKMHKIVYNSFFLTIPASMLIDYFTISGPPYSFTLYWKSMILIILFINLFFIKKELYKPDIFVQIPLFLVFIPFSYLISIVPQEKIHFLNLTYMAIIGGLSVISTINYKRMLPFIILSITLYLLFYFVIIPHSLKSFFDSLGLWTFVFLIIIPFVSDYNYIRAYKEIKMRIILQEKNEEITKQSEEIEKQKDELQELNITKDKFFSIISHDLKNPISSLAITLNTLYEEKDEISDEEVKEILFLSKDSAKNLYELLENLLDWSRSQRNVININPLEFDVNYLINNNIHLFDSSLNIKKIKVIFENTEPLTCFADIPMTSAAIRNLISNAIKFSNDKGTLTIKASEYDEKYNLVSISDSGIGMPLEIINKLFRIDANSSRLGTNQEKGTGLGLILCKEFIEKNGGQIWVESVENVGSTFFFTIPKR